MINKQTIQKETVSAIFIIIFSALFVLTNLTVGFIWPLYVLAVGLGFAISLIYPRSGVLAIIFLIIVFEKFFTLSSLHIGRVEYKIYPIDCIYLGILASVFYQIILGKIKLTFRKADKIFLGFLGLNILMFIFSVFIRHFDFALAFSTFKNYVFYSLFYFVIIFLFRDKEYIKQLFKFFLAGAITVAIFVLIGLVRGEGLWIEFNPLSTEGVRTLGFAHGLYLSLALIAILVLLIFKKLNSKFWQIIIFIWAIGIVGTLMRHIWLAIFLTLIALYIFIPKENKARMRKLAYRYLAIFAVLFIVIFYISAMFPQSKVGDYKNSITEVILSRTKSLGDASGDESLSWRKLVWSGVYDNWKTSPIFGTGTGRVIYVESRTYKSEIEARNIHNSVFAILLQFGLAGVFVFLWFIYENVKDLIKNRNTNQTLKYSLLSVACFYTVAILFQPYLESNFLGIFFWILLGLVRIVASDSRKSTYLADSPRCEAGRRANPLQIYK